MLRVLTVLMLMGSLGACSSLSASWNNMLPGADSRAVAMSLTGDRRVLLDPGALDLTSSHRMFEGIRPTLYEVARGLNGQTTLRARGIGTASLVGRMLPTPLAAECSVIEWSWKVDVLQASADPRVREQEDVAAALFLAFQNPGSYGGHVVRLIWTTNLPLGTVVKNPSFPAFVRDVVLATGSENLGEWQTYKIDVREIFRRAWQEELAAPLVAAAYFVDSDQTRQAVAAEFGQVAAYCDNPTAKVAAR